MSSEESYQIFTKPTCPWGRKAIALLEEREHRFEVHYLELPEKVDDFKSKHGVATTPQIFIGNQRIGGYTDLANRFGDHTLDAASEKTYRPVIAVFAITALMAIATGSGIKGFMGFSLCVLAALKIMDLDAFRSSFQNYDLITKAFPAYGLLYPFLELASGLGFLSGWLPTMTGAVALCVGVAGGLSVYKAVYVDHLDLNCACVGGNDRVPLGAISFTENAVMAVMGLWVLLV